MPTLNWIGKEKVLNHHNEVPYRVLEKKYSYGDKDSDNMIIHGDNLLALKALLPKYEGKVKCIYIDPPYNTGNEGWIYNDNVNDPKIKKWLGEVVGKEGEDLSRHDKWLCMMYPRLRLLQKLLSNDGFIFVSIDVFEYSYLKCLMDEIFGSSNFRNCIAVRRGIKNVQAQYKEVQGLSLGHEYIYLYSKTPTAKLPKLSKEFDIEKAGKWDTFWRGTDRPTMRYNLFGNHPTTGQWRWEESRAKKAIANYQTYLTKASDISLDDYYLAHLMATNEKLDFVRCNESGTIQYYVSPKSEKLLSDNWMDILLSGSYAGFVTEKNVELIERIVKWITEDNDVVLDSFAGSGTTAHAVLNINRQDGKIRKFILVEMEDYAEKITSERVKKVIGGSSKDNKVVEGKGGGFSFYELGEEIFVNNEYINSDVDNEKIREYIWYMETKTPYKKEGTDNEFYLGLYNDTAYYFYYDKQSNTTLDVDFLNTIKTKADSYIIFADTCTLSEGKMSKYGITFKKIPRDIRKI